MKHYGTWFSDETQQVRLMTGLDNVEGIFQPIWLCDSISGAVLYFMTSKVELHQILSGTASNSILKLK